LDLIVNVEVKNAHWFHFYEITRPGSREEFLNSNFDKTNAFVSLGFYKDCVVVSA